ncbi:MAG: hypothetical protein RJS97_08395 [Parvibaculaceae bacterium]
MLALLVERRKADGAHVGWYCTKSRQFVGDVSFTDCMEEPSGKREESMCFKLEGEGFYGLDELERNPRYARYDNKPAQLYRFIIRLYTQFSAKHINHKLALVELSGNAPVREIRLPGLPYLLPTLVSGDVVEQGFSNPDKQDLIKAYLGQDEVLDRHVRLFEGDTPDSIPDFSDTLFLCQAILSTWTNQRADVVAYVNSPVFDDVVKAVAEARRTAFDESPKARQGYRLHHELPRDISDPEILDQSQALHAFLVEKTRDALAGFKDQVPMSLDALSSCSPLRDFLRLWQYESLDCRAAWWVEREARRIFKGTESPLANMAFRLLCRVADNVEDRKQAFTALNRLDLADEEKALIKEAPSDAPVDVAGLRDKIEGLWKIKDHGWRTDTSSPWLIGRDQAVRCLVIGEQLANRLLGSPLGFSYAAYDYHNGIAQMCWSHSGRLDEDRTEARNLVDGLIELRQLEMHVAGAKRGDFVGTGRRVASEEGVLVAGHTVRRAFTLEIQGANLRQVDRVMNRILQAAEISTTVLK